MASRTPFYQEGEYFGRVTAQGLTTSKTGTVQFVLKCKIFAYPDDTTGERTEIATNSQYDRTLYMPLTEKTMEYQVENLQRLGFEGDDLARLDPSVEGYHNFVGQELTLYCQHQEYNGAQQERWNLSRPRELVTKEVDPRAMRNLNTLFGKAKRAAGTSGGPQAVRTPPRTAQPPAEDYADQGITDDDIPF